MNKYSMEENQRPENGFSREARCPEDRDGRTDWEDGGDSAGMWGQTNITTVLTKETPGTCQHEATL